MNVAISEITDLSKLALQVDKIIEMSKASVTQVLTRSRARSHVLVITTSQVTSRDDFKVNLGGKKQQSAASGF